MERIFRFPIKVGKESIDVLGHTNNKEYLRWMEEAALAHSDSLGWTEWTFVDLQTGRAADISAEVKKNFPLVPPDDPDLKASGVRRSPSQA